MKLSILHISDLHRDLNNELGNAALLESLRRDIDRYDKNDPPIGKPNLCIVSGDLVYGAKRGSVNFTDELVRQYQQAEELLVSVANTFLDGNRERVVIVPGNHDISYNDVLNAAVRVPMPAEDDKKQRSELVRELCLPGTNLRWSWDDLQFYRIENTTKYAARLGHFASTYNSFYQGSRTFSLDAREQFGVFSFPDLNLTVLGLNSCYNNDPLHRMGSINRDALVAATNHLRQAEHAGRLVAAVWHHSLFGGPTQEDYLDSEILLHLVDAGVSLGFHGHHHRVECIEERHRIAGNGRKMAVISAGTLCAGPAQLPPGRPRGYNLIEVNMDTKPWNCRVHQRKMHNDDFTYPIWVPEHFIESNRTYLDFSVDQPMKSKSAHLDFSLKVERAEQFMGSEQWVKAIDILVGLPSDSVGRVLLVTALSNLDNSRRTIELLCPPKNVAEAVVVGDAILRDGTEIEASRFLDAEIVSSSTDSSVREIVRRVRKRWTK